MGILCYRQSERQVCDVVSVTAFGVGGPEHAYGFHAYVIVTHASVSFISLICTLRY